MKWLSIIFILLFIVGCKINNKEKVNSQIVLNADSINKKKYALDNEMSWAQELGTYVNEDKNLLLNICVYKRQEFSNVTSSFTTDTVIKKKILNEYDLDNEIDYNNHSDNTKISIPVAYYEIVQDRKPNLIGKLYQIGKDKRGYYGGGVFASDTTDSHGYFFVRTYAFEKPMGGNSASDVITYEKNKKVGSIHIASTHPKAQSICQQYKKVFNIPYRIIRDEEVNKPKTKNAKP